MNKAIGYVNSLVTAAAKNVREIPPVILYVDEDKSVSGKDDPRPNIQCKKKITLGHISIREQPCSCLQDTEIFRQDKSCVM